MMNSTIKPPHISHNSQLGNAVAARRLIPAPLGPQLCLVFCLACGLTVAVSSRRLSFCASVFYLRCTGFRIFYGSLVLITSRKLHDS
jgi:hypothetical protein